MFPLVRVWVAVGFGDDDARGGPGEPALGMLFLGEVALRDSSVS